MIRRALLIVAATGLPLLAQMLAQTNNGGVSGEVRGQDGKPAAAIRVLLKPPPLMEAAQRPTFSTLTNSSGLFRMEGIPAGSYSVVAGAAATPTFFPGTTDEARAGQIVVEARSVTEKINFTLQGPVPDSPSLQVGKLQSIRGRIVVDGAPQHGRRIVDPFELSFSDQSKPQTIAVRFEPGKESPAPALTRVFPRVYQGSNVTAVIQTSESLNDSFQLALPDGEYRVIPTGRPNPGGYYLKGLSFGTADLQREVMKVRSPLVDELVITLAPCDATTPACR